MAEPEREIHTEKLIGGNMSAIMQELNSKVRAEREAKNVLLEVIDKFVEEVRVEAERQRDEADIGIADYFTAMQLVQKRWHEAGK